MEVWWYTDSKIDEFSEEIERLKRQYQAFLRKLRIYEPNAKDVPWTERSYTSTQEKNKGQLFSIH